MAEDIVTVKDAIAGNVSRFARTAMTDSVAGFGIGVPDHPHSGLLIDPRFGFHLVGCVAVRQNFNDNVPFVGLRPFHRAISI